MIRRLRSKSLDRHAFERKARSVSRSRPDRRFSSRSRAPVPRHESRERRDTRGRRAKRDTRATREEIDVVNAEIPEENINKFVQYKKHGIFATEVCRVISIDEVPKISRRWEVVVQVKASTVTINDCYIRRGIWHEKIPVPNTPGFDIVGTIVQAGNDAKAAGFGCGDDVAACCRTGGNTRYIVLHHKDLARAPENVDSAQAAAVVSTYMTAYQALHRCIPRRPKQTLEGVNILVTGGNGAVGKAVIELAHRAGANKIFATAANRYHDELDELGVCPLPLDSQFWLPLIKGKMDIVIDGICQDGYVSPLAALNRNGHLIIIGMTKLMNAANPGLFGGTIDTSVARFKSDWLMSKTTRYCPYESSQNRPKEWKHDLEYLFVLLARGKIHPEVTQLITLEAVPSIHEQLESAQVDGPIICKPWE